MSINYSIEKLKTEIYKDINNSNLPVGIIYLLFKDILHDISEAYQNACLQEMNVQMKESMKELEERNNGETISSTD